MESAGSRLKKIRLEKGIDIEEVHKKTKIHLDILKAIEEDRLINFNPVYIKGFLKIYCKFLGQDPKDYITDYREAKSRFEPKSQAEKNQVSMFKKASFLKFDFLKKINIEIIKKVLAYALILVFIIGLFNLGKSFSSRHFFKGKAKLPNIRPVKVEKKNEAVKPLKTRPAVVTRQEQQAQPDVKASNSSLGVRLTIRAKENCWIQLKSDGKVVFQRTLMKGRSETWQAKEKIELSLGNAGVVELQANDKFFSSLGKKGQSVKNIVITREGLNIVR